MIIFWYSASLQFLRITSSRTWLLPSSSSSFVCRRRCHLHRSTSILEPTEVV
jgi:hypothetical protein